MAKRVCRDCKEAGRPLTRPAPHPGPRCATCHRARRKASQKAAHGRRIEQVYGITEYEYDALYEAQGGVCAICLRATGKVRKLAVDHDHAIGDGKREAVRGLLCKSDNRLLGFARDDPEFFRRAMNYLLDPPARKVLNGE
jgi:hypothetical protein